MKKVTFLNLVQMLILAILGLSALVGAMFFGAIFHYLTAIMCAILSYSLFVDHNCGESVRDYFYRKRNEKKSK